jgi:hypothetical protein
VGWDKGRRFEIEVAQIDALRHFRKWCKLVFWRDSSARKRWRKPTGMIYAANF